jgi:hypothetical protein
MSDRRVATCTLPFVDAALDAARFGLEPLPNARAHAGELTAAFDFGP